MRPTTALKRSPRSERTSPLPIASTPSLSIRGTCWSFPRRPRPVFSSPILPMAIAWGTREALRTFYPQFGDQLKKYYCGWTVHIFTADLKLPGLLRLAPSRRVPLFNGAIECRLFEFRMVAGSPRKPPPSRPIPFATTDHFRLSFMKNR